MAICTKCNSETLKGESLCEKHWIEAKYQERNYLDNSDSKDLGIIKWAKDLLPEYLPQATPYFHIEMLMLLFSLLDPFYKNRFERQRNIISFRGSSKSTLINFIFLIYILCHIDRKIKITNIEGKVIEVTINEKFIAIASETGNSAEDFAVRLRNELSTNRNLIFFYGGAIDEAMMEKTGQWSKRAFRFNKCFVISVGVGQQIRGKIKGASRPTFIICHKKGSKVYDNGRLLNIEDTNWDKQEGQGDCLTININGIPIKETVTKEHRYWGIKRNTIRDKNGNYIYSFTKPDWVEAKDLTLEHYIGTPIDNSISEIQGIKLWKNKGKKITRNPKGQIVSFIINQDKEYEIDIPSYFNDLEFWWAYGLWLGDGHRTKTQLGWTCANKYPEIKNRLIEFISRYGAYHIYPKKGCEQIIWANTALSAYLKKYKEGNSIKFIPKWIQQLPDKYIINIIKGYLDSDGWIDYNCKPSQARITSINYEVLLQISGMLARLGIVSYIRKGAGERIETFDYEMSVSKQKYDLMFSKGLELFTNEKINVLKRTNAKAIFIDDGFIWRRISSISEAGIQPIVKVSLPSHSYLTPFGLSHNCDDIYSENNVKTEGGRETVTKWFESAIANTLDDLMGKIVVVGTILHEDTVLIANKRSSSWKTVEYPLMPLELFQKFVQEHLQVAHQKGTCQLPYEDKGIPEFELKTLQREYFRKIQEEFDWKLAWKERIDLYFIALQYQQAIEKNTLGSLYQEYFHLPVSDEMKRIKPEYFRHIKEYNLYEEFGYLWFKCDLFDKPMTINTEIGLDTGTGTPDGDESVATVAGILSNGYRVIFKQVAGKYDLRDVREDTGLLNLGKLVMERDNLKRIGILDEALRLALEYKAKTIKIGYAGSEKNNVTLLMQLAEANKLYNITVLGRRQDSAEGTKRERILNKISPYYQSYSVIHALGLGELEIQLQNLMRTTNDDKSDSAEVALWNMQQPFHIEVDIFKKKPNIRWKGQNRNINVFGDWRTN